MGRLLNEVQWRGAGAAALQKVAAGMRVPCRENGMQRGGGGVHEE